MAEQEIVGLKAIALEMGVSIPGLYSLIEKDSFLVYKRRLARVRPGARRWAWCTTPSLIHTWRTAKAITDRRDFLAVNRAGRTPPRDR